MSPLGRAKEDEERQELGGQDEGTWLQEEVGSTNQHLTLPDELYVYNHADPVVFVLCPGYVACEKSAVPFLLMDPNSEVP